MSIVMASSTDDKRCLVHFKSLNVHGKIMSLHSEGARKLNEANKKHKEDPNIKDEFREACQSIDNWASERALEEGGMYHEHCYRKFVRVRNLEIKLAVDRAPLWCKERNRHRDRLIDNLKNNLNHPSVHKYIFAPRFRCLSVSSHILI